MAFASWPLEDDEEDEEPVELEPVIVDPEELPEAPPPVDPLPVFEFAPWPLVDDDDFDEELPEPLAPPPLLVPLPLLFVYE